MGNIFFSSITTIMKSNEPKVYSGALSRSQTWNRTQRSKRQLNQLYFSVDHLYPNWIFNGCSPQRCCEMKTNSDVKCVIINRNSFWFSFVGPDLYADLCGLVTQVHPVWCGKVHSLWHAVATAHFRDKGTGEADHKLATPLDSTINLDAFTAQHLWRYLEEWNKRRYISKWLCKVLGSKASLPFRFL